MQVNRLSPVLGAEVLGLDFSKPLDPATIDRVVELLAEHQMLCFRNQSIDANQQVAACRRFGDLESIPSESGQPKFLSVVSNVLRDGKQVGFLAPEFLIWHSDLCYVKDTAKATFLYAHTVPEQNGETWFANQFAAYDEMPDDLRRKVEGRQAVFSLNRGLVERFRRMGWDVPANELSEKDFTPDVLHPAIRSHPITQRRAIFVNWAHVDQIEGYSPGESLELLESIFAHSTKERYLYRHHYRKNDLVVWDNASLLHSGAPKHPVGDRIMHRVVVLGTAPYYRPPSPRS